MSEFPLNTETECEVKLAEKLRDWQKGDKKAEVWKVGLLAPNGAKIMAEEFVWPDVEPPTVGAKLTYTVEPGQGDYAPKAKRKSKGRGRGGGGYRPDPVLDLMRQVLIVHQHSQTQAVTELTSLDSTLSVEDLPRMVDERARALTAEAVEVTKVHLPALLAARKAQGGS